jgi:basic amino acid/polyamine antiporter, APA family
MNRFSLSAMTRTKAMPSISLQGGVVGEFVRTISLFNLIMMGVGCTLGTGIFFALTETVPIAGPAVVISFIIAGFTAGISALCYAEVSARIPIAGSAYTFAYMTMGEVAAVFVGSCLILEWGIAAAAVAVGWSSYLNQLISIMFGLEIPAALKTAPFLANGKDLTLGGEGYVNLPAVILVWVCALLLLRGSKESTTINTILTLTKVIILVLFVVMTIQAFNFDNFHPFMPNGIEGVGASAAIVFFSYIGLDAIVGASEEVKNPSRNIPLAVVIALIIVTSVYILVAVSSLGAQVVSDFTGQEAGLAIILEGVTGGSWSAALMSVGAVISVFSVTLVAIFGQTRVCFAMSRDGLLPKLFSKIHVNSGVPRAGTLTSALLITPLAGLLPSHLLWGMVSMGTLVAFSAVAMSLMILRHKYPEPIKGFQVPLYPITPILSILACGYLIYSLTQTVYITFGIWVAIAAVLYLMQGIRHSKLSRLN